MKVLSRNQIRIEPHKDGIHVFVSELEHEGARWWTIRHLTDLENEPCYDCNGEVQVLKKDCPKHKKELRERVSDTPDRDQIRQKRS